MNLFEARKLAKLLNLPPLVGNTLKEINEAEIIRASKLQAVPWYEENWDNFISELDARFLPDDCLIDLRQSNLTQFWIQNRDMTFWELLEFFQ
ncbi:hypothetical protein H6S82_10685 [Planktothrix sp. FACHB-1355]|uniref:Uncharacterized protein n=1 Tax=Aerosakkonema funiforme FACHB-1375 TaxID=2949571 RepID=A0A926V9E2_9CYAN|nr:MULTISPECIES: hypothetical protein [Oscillatoriales]MBD2179636.1 hypothetical protein [Aerosakkonema funiforme FACHB-1375]MBD3559327.1 hypothetical protein [Planktothrix sp. FACHB-1355]